MTRIGTFGANQVYISRLLNMQQRIYDEQLQVATEKKTPRYSGISSDASRLISLENQKMMASEFIRGNGIIDTKLKAASTSLEGVTETIREFRNNLLDFAANQNRSGEDVENIQGFAFRAMQDIQAYLSSNVEGQYLFSGGKINSVPISLPASNLGDFQTLFDGFDHAYPTSRPAHLQELETDPLTTGNLTVSTAAGTISAANVGSLANIQIGSQVTVGASGNNVGKTFTVYAKDPADDTIRVSRLLNSAGETGVSVAIGGQAAATSADYASVDFSADGDVITFNGATFDTSQFQVGTVFTLSGSAGVADIDGQTKNNNGVYQVESISAGPPFEITIASTKLATEGGAVAATLSSTNWYNGDTAPVDQRIDENRTIDMGLYASDPGIEKALRALGIIAQGAVGTAGGLESNMDRVDQALWLLSDSLGIAQMAEPPFGTELAGSTDGMGGRISMMSRTVNLKIDDLNSFVGLMETNIIGIENVDRTEAVARLMDDMTALEAGYEAVSRVRGMSLLNHLK